MSEDILSVAFEDDEEFDDFADDGFDADGGFDAELDVVTAELIPDSDEGDLSETRAREITEAIRSAATVTFLLLARAHEHNAHKALGYATWADYVKNEFDMSAQRSYQLLDLSKVTHEIESVVPDGTEVKLTEAQARDIKRELPMVTEKIRAGTEGADPEDAAATVNSIVEEIRDQKKADEKALADKKKADEDAQREGYQAGLESAADSLLEADGPDGITDHADDELIEVTVEGDGDMSPEDSMNLYNFFNVLSGLTSLPEPDEFVRVVPKARAQELEGQLMEAASWLNRFQTLWEMKDE